jgi:uncharacterized protein HemY
MSAACSGLPPIAQ